MFMWNVSSMTPARRVIDAIDDVDGLRRQIDDTGFEPVQWLDAEDDAVVAGHACQLGVLTDQEIPVSGAFVRRRVPRPADTRIQRADDVDRAKRLRGGDAVPDVLHARLANVRVRMDEVAVRPNHRADTDREAVIAGDRGAT